MSQSMLETTMVKTGVVKTNGPFETNMLTKWVYKQKEMHPHEYCQYKVVDIPST